MLYTGCISRWKEWRDKGLYIISVMSQHTDDGGLILCPEYDEWCDEHWSEIGPSRKLVGDRKKRCLEWEKFEERYFRQIRQSPKREEVEKLVRLALEIDIIIVCVEAGPQRCHRRLLAEECQRMFPVLQVVYL